MDTTLPADPSRRDFLFVATGAVAAVGAAAATWPLISQLNPDTSTVAGGAPIEVDLAPIAEGQSIKVFWRGAPIFINHRTPNGDRIGPQRRLEDADRSAVRRGSHQGGP